MVVGVIGVGTSGCSSDPPACMHEGCLDPPAVACSTDGRGIIRYEGTCTPNGCEYIPRLTSCAPQSYACYSSGVAHCGDAEGSCHQYACPSTRSRCVDETTLQVSDLTCPPYPNLNCQPSNTTNTDCRTLVSPPPATCAGTVLWTHAATGSCFNNACGYAATSVDCAATNQVCNAATGACT
jgi:hypothetical protein